MAALKGRERAVAWTLPAPEEIVLGALQESPEGLTDHEIAERVGMSVSAVQRYRARLMTRGLVRSHSKRDTMRYVQGKCPKCGSIVQVALGLHSGTKVWRPSGDALKVAVGKEEQS